ncbi:MAG: cytochrome bc1 complex diheme cytochrome c subunit [Nocardioidaceae bacterium]
MKSLSTHRRHPFAGLVVVMLGLVVAGSLYAAIRPAAADKSGDTSLIAEGREVFVVGCASCHGLNAEGLQTKSGGNYGPSLIGVGAAAVDFQVSTGRMPAQRPDTQIPDKPEVYNDDEIAALAAYIASLAPGPAIPSEADYTTEGASLARGGEFFFTNCTACHNFIGAGGALPDGRYAPSLQGVEPKHILEAMLTGPQQMPGFNWLEAQDKRDIIAYIQSMEEKPSYGGSALGSKGPVTEGLWGWVAGIGALVLASVWIGNNGVRSGKKPS